MKKKTLYIKSPNAAWMDIAAVLQTSYGFEPVLWVSSVASDHGACKARFPETGFLDHFDLLRAQMPAEVSQPSRCVDGGFLEANAWHEDIFYNMVDRWSGDPEAISMEKRRAYYIDMANLWFALYEHYKIDVVLIPTVPHRLYDYMAYVVAKALDIPVVMMNESNDALVDGQGEKETLFFFIDDVFDQSGPIRECATKKRVPSVALQRYIDMSLADYDTIQPTYFKEKKDRVVPLSERVRTLFRDKVPLPLRMPVHLVKHFVQTASFYNHKLVFPYRTRFGSSVVFQNIAAAMVRHQKVKARTQAAKDWYGEHAALPDTAQKYIYFAPSFQPERSSTPDAGVCQWPELMIEMIAASIPDDWVIYFKEHPSNYRAPILPDNNRSAGFYERLKAIAPMLEYVPLDLDPLELIDNAQCVVTANGTSAWQAVSRGIPAMIFGEIWFKDCPGVAHVQNLAACRDWFSGIEAGYKVDRDEVIQYLCKLEEIGGLYGWARGKASGFDLEGQARLGSIEDFCAGLYAKYQEINAQLHRSEDAA